MADDFEDYADDECGNCGGLGIVPGCFECTCCGADCDPDEAEWCCNPQRCDYCRPIPHSYEVSGLQKILADALQPSVSGLSKGGE